MADNFFEKKENVEEKVEEEKQEESPEEEKEEIEKIRVGEDEYTQDELSSLISLGKIGQEAEEKTKTKIDRIWPEYTKARQELKELKEKAEIEEKTKVEKKVAAGEELSDEETIQQALEQAEKMGISTKRTLRNEIMGILEARDLLDTCKGMEKEMDGSDGKPAFKTQDILAHMQETGLKNPERAYKDKFEEQIDRWKEEQLKKAKPEGLVTEGASGAGGGKEPSAKKITGEDALRSVIRESLWGKGE